MYILRHIYLILLLIALSLFNLNASDDYQGWLDHGEVALKQSLVDLTNNITIACLAAHPDDEDGATLTYCRKRFGAKTAIILTTRGEGGQNEIGTELYEELGVIRAYETFTAAQIYGAEVYNLNRRDFGFSKSAQETFRFWNHHDSLGRLVKAIRECKPDVIITNHDTEHGHGHHQATGIMALEAFDAAADPTIFPEFKPWQVKRLFVRCGKDEADVVINVGEYDQLRGFSYHQIANEGLKMHKSQGMGGVVGRGDSFRYYKLVKSTQPVTKKLDNLWDGLDKFSGIGEILGSTVSNLSLSRDEITRSLIAYIKHLRKSGINDPEMERKTEIALAKAMDIYLTVNPEDKIVTRGQLLKVQVSLTNCGKQKIEDISFNLEIPLLGKIVGGENLSFKQLGYNETATGTFSLEVSSEAPITLPAARYLYDDIFMKPLIKAIAHYKIYDTESSIISESKVDVAEDMAVYIYPEKGIIPVSNKEQRVRYVVNVINQRPDVVNGKIMMVSPHIDWDISGSEKEFTLLEDQQTYAAFDLIIPPEEKPGNYTIEVKSIYKMPDGSEKLSIARGSIKLMDVKVAQDIYVGYVKSYDNTIEWSLKQLNVKSKALESDDLRFGDLSVYDTIILDIRAYLVRKDLIDSNQRLLDYVKDGGNLIVMYNKTFEWKERFAPYRLIISNNRVTVEDAPIKILAPEHPLFNFPNAITQKDWEGWIQERGLYFPSEWSPEYKELLSCNDPGESPLTGGYLIAKYGKGTYIYTSYVWYRQLQELNPGAFRNFANMISLPENP